MFSPLAVIVTIAVYMALLFAFAQLAERTKIGKAWAQHPIVFALGLAVYCTTWTYYGSVGKASVGGMGFLPVYLGPTLALLVGGAVFRRIIELKEAHKITSIADFISARYAKSQAVAALVTGILAVGIVPYIALQIKAVTATFDILTHGHAAAGGAVASWFGPAVVAAMVVFTIVFGIRHLDPTERHPGMVVSLAAESLVKLVAFIAAGAFVVGAAFGGFGGFESALEKVQAGAMPLMGKSSPQDTLGYVTVTLLSMAAFAFLPRQFHVGVVESTTSKHVKTARWLTPLYLLAINVFVVPLALGGKMMAAKGTAADYYVLALPLQAGQHGLSLAVFVGGFSAAIGMIMIESMTMATMISNHLALPLIQAIKPLRGLRRRTLQVRWLAAAGITVAGYEFAVKVGASYPLVVIGLISFAAAFILAPIVLGGLYWRGANRAGALAGLSAGFAMWMYTLMLPTFVRSKWLPESILTQGPFGAAWLKPEALFGWTGVPSLAHGTIWCTIVTVSFFVLGSVAFRASKEEKLLTEAFLDDAANQLAHLDANATIVIAPEREGIVKLFSQYFSSEEAEALADKSLAKLSLSTAEKMSIGQKAELFADVERSLAGAIGAASAHGAMKKLGTIDRKDKRALEREFARTLAALKISPTELKKRVDYQKERETLLEEQFHALEEKIAQRDAEIVERQKAEVALQSAHDELEQRVIDRTKELRAILDNVVFGFFCIDADQNVKEGFTQSCKELLGTGDIAGRRFAELLGVDEKTPDGATLVMTIDQVFSDLMPEDLAVSQIPHRFVIGDRILRIEGRVVRDTDGSIKLLLMTISDVTQLEAAQRENEGNRALLHILRQRSSFEAFLSDTRSQLARAHDAVGAGDQVVVRRVAHTIKGNVSLYGVAQIARLIHEIEEEHEIDRPHLEQIGSAFRQFLETNAHVLGLTFDTDAAKSFTLTDGNLQKLRGLLSALPIDKRASFETVLHELTLVPAAPLLGPIESLVEGLGERLDKRVVARVEGGEVRVDEERLAPILQNLPHLIRNSLDHGIEPADERGDKPEVATVRLAVSETERDYCIVVEDDGRGIDAERVVASAVKKGVISAEQGRRMSEQDKLQLIFLDSVSTAAEVTVISGRGVGMSAIRQAALDLGGSVVIDTAVGRGTKVILTVPKFQVAESAPYLKAAS